MNKHTIHGSSQKILTQAIHALAMVVTGAFISTPVIAQSTWTGGGNPDFNWQTGANWGGTAPVPGTGTSLIFDGNVGLLNTNDFAAGSNFKDITFAATASPFVLGGNGITLNGYIYNNSGAVQTFGMDLALSGAQHNIVDSSGASTTVFDGAINYGSGRLFPNSANTTVILNGAGTGSGQTSTAYTVSGASTWRANAVTYLGINNSTALGTGWFQVNADTYINSTSGVNLGNAFVIGNGRLRFNGGNVEISGGSVTGSAGTTTAAIVGAGGNREISMYHTGTTTISGDVYISDSDTSRTLTTYFNQNGRLEISGNVHNNLANIGGGGTASSLYKNGTGTLSLSGHNDYNGTTTVASGTLLVNGTHNEGSGANAGRYLVNAGGTLGGVGTIHLSDTDGGTTGISISGVLAPGDGGIGLLTVDGLDSVRSAMSLEVGGALLYDLGLGLTSDQLTLVNAQANDIIFNGNTINFNDLTGGSLASGQYTLFSSDAANAYSGLTLSGNVITGGLSIGTGLEAYSSDLEVSGNNIVLNVAPVPEPNAFALGALGLVSLFVFRWRK